MRLAAFDLFKVSLNHDITSAAVYCELTEKRLLKVAE